MTAAGTIDGHGLELGAEDWILASQGLLPDGGSFARKNLYEEDVFLASQGFVPDRPGLADLAACACKESAMAARDVKGGMADYVTGLSGMGSNRQGWGYGMVSGMGDSIPGGGTIMQQDAANFAALNASRVPSGGGFLDTFTEIVSGIGAGTGVILRDPNLGPIAGAGLAKLVPGAGVTPQQPVYQEQQGPSWGKIALVLLGVGAAGLGARHMGWI